MDDKFLFKIMCEILYVCLVVVNWYIVKTDKLDYIWPFKIISIGW